MPFLKYGVVIFFIVTFRTVSCAVDSFARQEVESLKNLGRDNVKVEVNMEDTVHALERVVFYFGKMKKSATVDLVFGMQGVHGELAKILTLEKEGKYNLLSSNGNILLRLKELLVFTKEYIEESLPYVKQSNLEYYRNFYSVIKNPWTPYELPPQLTEVDSIDIFPNFTLEEMSEAESDKCMQVFLDPNKAQLCDMGNCFHKMTKMGGKLYDTTHQILWLTLGEQAGCRSVIEDEGRQIFPGGLDQMLKMKCAGIAMEMEAISKYNVPDDFKDVFLEQGFICGKLGFMDTIKPSYVLSALKWQNLNTGCYMAETPNEIDHENNNSINEFMFWVNMKKEEWKSRNILVDSVLNDKCSTHMTAVAAGFLAVSLRLFFNPLYKQSQLNPYLKLIPPPELPHNNSHTFAIIFLSFMVIGMAVYMKRRFIRIPSLIKSMTDNFKGGIKNL